MSMLNLFCLYGILVHFLLYYKEKSQEQTEESEVPPSIDKPETGAI